MTPEMQAAVARLRLLSSALVETGEAESAEDAQALALVLAAVTPREGAEALVFQPLVGELPHPDTYVSVCSVFSVAGEFFATVYGSTEAEALARARAVAQVAAREVEHA